MAGLAGRTALITGAGRGIGRATAVRLAREGERFAGPSNSVQIALGYPYFVGWVLSKRELW